MDSTRVERDVLGSVLLESSVWEQAKLLPEQDFSLEAHRLISRRMRDLAESERPIDFTTLPQELDRHKELDLIGGLAYLTSLIDGLPERKNISHYLGIMQECAIRRRGAKAGEALHRLANDGSVSATAMADVASSIATELVTGDDALPPQFSEERLALRFSHQHEGELRYVAGWRRWMCWDGTRWHEDETLAVFDRARAICRRASAECGDAKVAGRRKACRCPNGCRSRTPRPSRTAGTRATVEQWDADPWLLNTPAGTVDLRTGELNDHRREQYLTKITAAGPGGDCPLWRRFLDRITDGNSELQAFLQRVIGYCLSGFGTRARSVLPLRHRSKREECFSFHHRRAAR